MCFLEFESKSKYWKCCYMDKIQHLPFYTNRGCCSTLGTSFALEQQQKHRRSLVHSLTAGPPSSEPQRLFHGFSFAVD